MYAAVLLPNFELQCALRAEPELGLSAVALIAEMVAGVPTISQINAAAETEGVVVGMSLPQAQARCGFLEFKRRNPAQETVVTATLLQACERISPFLENTSPGCCTLDLRRNGKLDEENWAKDLISDLKRLNLNGQIGIAATPDAARQAARLASPVLITDASLQTLSDLPVLVLEPSSHLLDILCDWGIQRVADLRALDRQQVAERLGLEGVALWDRAAGGTIHPLRLVRASESYVEIAEFEGGVETLEPVLFRLRRALEQVSRRLRADFVLAGTIEFILELDDRSKQERTIQIPAPTCEVDVLFRVLCTYLDTVQTETRVNGFRLEAFPSTPRDHQAQLWGSSLPDPNAFSETLARLSGIVGGEHVGTPRRLPTHRPSHFRMESPDFENNDSSGRRPRPKVPFGSSSPTFPPVGMSLRRYRPPSRLTVKIQDGQPVYVRGPSWDGEIRACAGPWRLDGNWWEERTAWRWEEWDVEMARGGLYRLANHRRENWWMLGLYD